MKPAGIPSPMSRLFEIAVLALGGLSLFAVSFLGFALSAGVPLKDLAVVGSLLPDRPPPAPAALPAPAPVTPPTDAEVVAAHLGLLGIWSLESPFDAGELEALASRLQAKEHDLDRRLEEARERQSYLEDRGETLGEQHAELERIRQELEAYRRELDLREEELRGDEQAAARREAASWEGTARLFRDGDASDLAERLVQFDPADAARILRSLEEDRAAELLDALPQKDWKSYADAYVRAR